MGRPTPGQDDKDEVMPDAAAGYTEFGAPSQDTGVMGEGWSDLPAPPRKTAPEPPAGGYVDFDAPPVLGDEDAEAWSETIDDPPSEELLVAESESMADLDKEELLADPDSEEVPFDAIDMDERIDDYATDVGFDKQELYAEGQNLFQLDQKHEGAKPKAPTRKAEVEGITDPTMDFAPVEADAASESDVTAPEGGRFPWVELLVAAVLLACLGGVALVFFAPAPAGGPEIQVSPDGAVKIEDGAPNR